MWEAFSLVCVLSIFFFLLSSFILFLLVFFLTDTSDSEDSREVRRNHYFSCFPLPPAHKHSFSSSRFLPLLLNRFICNYQIDKWWDLFSFKICILFGFSLIQLSRSYWLWHFKVMLWEFDLIKLSPF